MDFLPEEFIPHAKIVQNKLATIKKLIEPLEVLKNKEFHDQNDIEDLLTKTDQNEKKMKEKTFHTMLKKIEKDHEDILLAFFSHLIFNETKTTKTSKESQKLLIEVYKNRKDDPVEYLSLIHI